MTIRTLESKDVESVERILDLYWTGDFRKNLSKRLHQYINQDPEVTAQKFKWFVADEDGEVVGAAAFRKAPEHMAQYARTQNPAEFYVAAVKEKGKGVGSELRSARIESARKEGFTEALFFSGETHQDSWPFHDNSEFKRVGPATAPNGEPGYVWRLGF